MSRQTCVFGKVKWFTRCDPDACCCERYKGTALVIDRDQDIDSITGTAGDPSIHERFAQVRAAQGISLTCVCHSRDGFCMCQQLDKGSLEEPAGPTWAEHPSIDDCFNDFRWATQSSYA